MWYATDMKRLLFMASLVLVGCSQSAGEKAEAEYRIARKSGVDSAQACEFEKRIRDAYLSDQDQRRYERWRTSAGISCNAADIDRLMEAKPRY